MDATPKRDAAPDIRVLMCASAVASPWTTWGPCSTLRRTSPWWGGILF